MSTFRKDLVRYRVGGLWFENEQALGGKLSHEYLENFIAFLQEALEETGAVKLMMFARSDSAPDSGPDFSFYVYKLVTKRSPQQSRPERFGRRSGGFTRQSSGPRSFQARPATGRPAPARPAQARPATPSFKNRPIEVEEPVGQTDSDPDSDLTPGAEYQDEGELV